MSKFCIFFLSYLFFCRSAVLDMRGGITESLTLSFRTRVQMLRMRILTGTTSWLVYQGGPFVLGRSNIYLSRFAGCPEFAFYTSLKNKLLRHGHGERSLIIFTNFLFFLKIVFQLDPVSFVQQAFLQGAFLPFRLYTVKSSNRAYTFPGPILSDTEFQNILIKNFGHALRRRTESGFLNKFFLELSYFLDQDPSSELVAILQTIVQGGIENRAFVHYRWRIKR